jgi:hypothetical protein
MKKFLTRIIAIALAAVLFVAPTTASAASIPELLYDDGISKLFVYQPDPLTLKPATSTNIIDTTTHDGFFDVPAGRSFQFHINTTAPFEIFVYLEGFGVILHEDGGGDYMTYFPATSSDKRFRIWIRSTLYEMDIIDYGVDLNYE